MASIWLIMFCAILAIATLVAVPVPNHEPGKVELHSIATPSPHHYRFILPSQNQHSLIEQMDDHRHLALVRLHPLLHRNITEVVDFIHGKVLVLDFLFNHTYLRAHLAHDRNGQLAHYPTSHLNSMRVRRHPSDVGTLTFKAMQGLMSVVYQSARHSKAVELTRNDRDHAQKMKEQFVVEEEKEDSKDKETAERKGKSCQVA